MTSDPSAHDTWAVAEAYEAYVGRWSRYAARAFVRDLAPAAGGRWLDVGRAHRRGGARHRRAGALSRLRGPFLGAQGPAPGYIAALPAEHRAALGERLRATLPFAADGSLPMTARAWAVRGIRPETPA